MFVKVPALGLKCVVVPVPEVLGEEQRIERFAFLGLDAVEDGETLRCRAKRLLPPVAGVLGLAHQVGGHLELITDSRLHIPPHELGPCLHRFDAVDRRDHTCLLRHAVHEHGARPVEGRPFKDERTFTYKVDDYNEYFLNQLYELLTEYGPIHEVWLDGAHPKRKGGQRYTYAHWYEKRSS